MQQKQEFTITIYTENQVGLINKLAIIFTRRKINIESINSSPSEVDGIYRFTLVVFESVDVVRKICRQIEKLIDVLKVYFNTNDEIIWQEMALYKLPTDEVTEKIRVERMLREYGARAVVIRRDYIIFETTGQRDEINKLIQIFSPYGLIEFVRSARIAIIKNSNGFHDKIKEFEQNDPTPTQVENVNFDYDQNAV